jgi:ABC-type uncharacterized transport system substrate-binding protein
MRRREFIQLLLGAAAAQPIAARAQAPKRARIGVLAVLTQSAMTSRIEAMRAGLRDLGYHEGQDLVLQLRWAEGKYERLDGLAAELVSLGSDVIVTHTTPGTLAVKRATTTIPIVTITGDALATGLITNLAHPGGNITGSTFLGSDLATKRLEIIKDAMPNVTRVGVLLNPDNATSKLIMQSLERASVALGMTVRGYDIREPSDLERAFAVMAGDATHAAITNEDGVILANLGILVGHALRQKIVAIGGDELVTAGGVIGYSPDLPSLFYRAALFIDKLLKGAKAADLPVEIPTKFRLAVNLKTAAALGIDLSPSLVARADEVIE